MALFFFDLDDGAATYSDTDGYEMDNLAAARARGLQALHNSMRDNVDNDAESTMLRMTILDAGRQPVWILTITLSSARPTRPN